MRGQLRPGEKVEEKGKSVVVIGSVLKIEDLFRDGYACVFIATGVWRPKTLGIRGEPGKCAVRSGLFGGSDCASFFLMEIGCRC